MLKGCFRLNIKSIALLILKIIGYSGAVTAAVFFALYLSASTGWMFVFIIGIAPLFSFAVTLITVKREHVSLTADVSGTTVYKQDILKLKITVKNTGFFPVPAAMVRLFSAQTLELQDEDKELFAVSVMPFSETVFEVKYKANLWGKASVGIKSFRLCDYMKFVSFSLTGSDFKLKNTIEIKVFPDIPDVPADSPLVRAVVEDIFNYDDSEETKETEHNKVFAGIPGYTHREYSEGDPIRRINWKLSAKRGKYMVRLDDETESMRQTIVLDSTAGLNVYDNERAVEGVLAICFSLIRLGYESTVWYMCGGNFASRLIESLEDVSLLRADFADYSFETSGKKVTRLPAGELLKSAGSGIMVYTPLSDGSLMSAVSDLRARGSHVSVVTTDSAATIFTENCWRLNAGFSAEKV